LATTKSAFEEKHKRLNMQRDRRRRQKWRRFSNQLMMPKGRSGTLPKERLKPECAKRQI
jgi:hypothetical protein